MPRPAASPDPTGATAEPAGAGRPDRPTVRDFFLLDPPAAPRSPDPIPTTPPEEPPT